MDHRARQPAGSDGVHRVRESAVAGRVDSTPGSPRGSDSSHSEAPDRQLAIDETPDEPAPASGEDVIASTPSAPAPDWLGVGPAAGYGAGAGGVGGAGDLGGPGDLGGYRGGGGLAGTGGPIVPAGRRRMLTLVGVAAAVIGLVIA